MMHGPDRIMPAAEKLLRSSHGRREDLAADPQIAALKRTQLNNVDYPTVGGILLHAHLGTGLQVPGSV